MKQSRLLFTEVDPLVPKYKMIILGICLIFLFTIPMFPEKIADLPEINRPGSMAIDESILYVCDQNTIHEYLLDPFQYRKNIGRKGEGPGEFNSAPYLTVYPDHFFINTMGKIMMFSKDGLLQDQIKLPFNYWYFYYPLLRAGKNYVGLPVIRIEEENTFIHVVNLYDTQLKLIKELHKGNPPQILPPPRPGSKIVKMDFEVIPDCLEVATCENKIYIADTRKGFYFAVFDVNGPLLSEINKDYTKIKVPDEFKENFWRRMRSSKNWEQIKQRFNYQIKDNFPAFFSVKIHAQKIYATTYAHKYGLYEVVVMDLEGNELERSFSYPLEPDRRLLTGIAPNSNEYAIHDGKIYYIVLNEDSMLYELHVSHFPK